MAPQTTLRAALLLTAFPLASALGAQQAPRVTKDAPATPTTAAQPPRTSGIDRSTPPTLPPTPPLRVPAIETRTLSNGITGAVLENHEIPGVRVGAGARINRCIIDKNVVVPPWLRVGFDLEEDAKRFTISDNGIVVIEKDRLLDR